MLVVINTRTIAAKLFDTRRGPTELEGAELI
jgi:hypothetical protein